MRTRTSFRSARPLKPAIAALTSLGALVAVACGSAGGSTFNDGTSSSSSGSSSGDNSANLADSGFSLDALAAEDPPNQWCGPDGGEPSQPPIGGSPDCPTDKNLQGCPCGPAGTTAACWPGLRANRDIGICKDGVTTCNTSGEVGSTWGPCVGAVLPTPGATTGPAACSCFSEGQWHIDNLVPFFITYSGDGMTFSQSTTQDPDGGATVYPVISSTNEPEPPPAPPGPWSTDELSVDCAGTFTLSYELKAGDYNNPLPTDCSLAKVTLPSTYYPTANALQPFPILPAWTADGSHTACANSFHDNGGYGEMSVVGESVLCQHIDNGSGGSFVFHRIQYCSAACTQNPSGPGCASCGQDGSGTFK